jgi:sigma54-dependent transcription regulator
MATLAPAGMIGTDDVAEEIARLRLDCTRERRE